MPSDADVQTAILHEVPAGPGDEGPGVVANSALNIAGRVVGNGISALSGLITANVLGPAAVGVLAVVFGVVELGRGLSNFTHNPSIMEVHRGKDPARVFGTSLALKLTGAAILFVAVAVSAPYVAATFDVPPGALILASSILLVGAFFEIGAARLESENRMLVSNMLLALGPVVGLLSMLAFIFAGRYNVMASIFTTLLGTAAMSIGFAFMWGSKIRFHYDGKIANYLVHYGSRLVLATFLTQGLMWTDTLLLSYLKGNYETGIYTVAFNLTFVMVTLSVSIGVALLPALSRLAGRGDSTTLAYQRGTVLALVLSVGIAIFYVAAGPLLLRLYGPAYTDAYPALVILTLFGIAGALAVPAASMLTVHGHANALMLISLAQLVVNIPLNYVLIRAWGITGAAVATTLVFVVGTAALWLAVRRSVGSWPLSRTVFGELREGVLHRR